MPGVLIDLDGTLLDSVPALYHVYQQFLQTFEVRGSKEEFDQLNGVDFQEVLTTLKSKHKLYLDYEELHVLYQDLIKQAYKHDVHLFPGVRTFLHYAKEAGWHLAVVTSTELSLAQLALNAQGILKDFEAIFTSEKLPKGKPDPMIYLEALQKLGLSPDQVVGIEDSAKGVHAALAAGIETLRFQPGIEKKSSANPYLFDVADWDEILLFLRRKWT